MRVRFTPRARGDLEGLGPHPDGGGNLQVMSGRYGSYVKFGKVNATLPGDKDPQLLTVAEAIALIAARAGKSPAKKKAPARKAAKKAAKKPAKPKKAKAAAPASATE